MKLIFNIFVLCAIAVGSDATGEKERLSIADEEWSETANNLRVGNAVRILPKGPRLEFKLRDYDLCISTDDYPVTSGMNLILWTCSGEKDNLWKYDNDNLLRNVDNDRVCIDEESDDNNIVEVYTCDPTVDRQKIMFVDGLLKMVGLDNKCITAKYPPEAEDLLRLEKCGHWNLQEWSLIVRYPDVLEK
eukprot:CAMPEP_0172499492 /NCGR_PEP_ID=MMETSP1066-20121228/128044_1 /TAXON_ID=671091 /ORGANISM="Coscinodiscus wailesii, Strain CCMP2513" /LENGTH=188 /DNA_ID=CAMNT_0013273271 /DNA_START=86 /DNA_END=652 /DNA_ORIENTATION=+